MSTLYLDQFPRPDAGIPAQVHFNKMQELVDFLHIDEGKLGRMVHIAGTNGKGSTVHYLKSFLTSEEYKVNAYTSPHLIKPNERFFLGNRFIEDEEFESYLKQIKTFPFFEELHFFQIFTAIGFLAFQDNPADYLLLETGLGGKYDMTNILKQKDLCIFTPIQSDHLDQLGSTVREITENKMGICRKGVPCLSAPQSPDVQKIFNDSQMNIDVLSFQSCDPDKIAFHLAHTATQRLLNRSSKAIRTSPLLGRFTIIRISSTQTVVLDVAHNEASMQALSDRIKAKFQNKTVRIIFGLQKTKDLSKISNILQSLTPEIIQLVPNSSFHPSMNNAHPDGFPPLASLISPQDEIIVICGSFQIVGTYLQDPILMNLQKDAYF